MKTTLSTLFALFLLASLLMACQSAPADPIQIGAQDAGKTITLNTGDTLRVALEGNPTTGYNWLPATQNPVLLEQVGDAQVTPYSNALGSSGMIVLQFKATAKGQTVLHLDYKRPFEPNAAPEQTFEVTVVVK